jgi:hypothetical protein
MAEAPTSHTIAEHFAGKDSEVQATYDMIVAAARKFGPVREEAKKSSIHLARKSAFAGVATRRTALILTLKSAADIESERIGKHERVSAGRWHLEVRLEAPSQVDRELIAWLRQAYELSG